MPGVVAAQGTTHARSKSKLMEAVLNGDSRWLLHLLKESELDQVELDEALHSAAWAGKADCVRMLLAAGAGLYSVNLHGEPLLVEAVYSGSVDVIKNVIEAGYDVNLMHGGQATGWSEPLHVAISARDKPNYDVIDALIDARLSLECKDVDGDTALIVACNMGDERLTGRLLSAGCRVDSAGYESNTALHRAAENGSVELVEMLLAAGADPLAENAAGCTALMSAAENGHAAVVDVLLRRVPRPALDAVNVDGKNCLHLAASSDGGGVQLVRHLVEAGISVQAVDSAGNTALVLACWTRNFDVSDYLLAVAVERCPPGDLASFVSAPGERRRTALHWTALHGALDTVNRLLAAVGDAANLDVPDAAGDTPILLAARTGRVQVLRTLIEHHFNVNARGELGRTALHWAVAAADCETVEALLAVEGVSVSTRDEAGCTPLLLAAANHRYAEMRAIVRAAADRAEVNANGPDGRTALHWVSKAGDPDMVRELLAVNADPNVRDAMGDTALLAAAKERHVAAALQLIASGRADARCADAAKSRQALHYAAEFGMTPVVSALVAQPDSDLTSADVDGRTALMLATMGKHEDVAAVLIDSGRCDVNVVDGTQRTSLFYAAQHGLVETVRKLLDAGADPDQKRSEPSPLIQACRAGNDEIVGLLLGRGAGINYRDGRRRTALMWASEGGHTRLVESLLAAGADAKAVDVRGDTALTISSWQGHRDVVRLLLPPVSDIELHEMDEGMTALHLAIAKDCQEIVGDLLEAGADLAAVDKKGNNALLTAMMHTSGSDIVQLILKHRARRPNNGGLDIDFRGDQGRSALHWAVGDPDCLQLVLGCRPDLDAVDTNGATPLLLAIAHSRADSAALLIDAGCDYQRVHKDGRAAIHHAAIYGVCETVEKLLALGVAPDTPTADGKTPVLLAAVEGHADIVAALVCFGCDVNDVYQDAMTPLSAAASGRHLKVLKVLLSAGADPNHFGSKKCSPLMTSILNDDVAGTVTLLQHGARLDQTLQEDSTKRPIHAAVVNNYIGILHVLVAAECDVNALRALLRDGVVYYFVNDPFFLAALRAAAASPRPLMALCRRIVRSRLTVPVLAKIDRLPVPSAVKEYLGMKDLEKVMVGLKEQHQQLVQLLAETEGAAEEAAAGGV